MGGGPSSRARPSLPLASDTFVIRVAQSPSEVRVAPQLPIGAVRYWVSVQVWAMYSVPNQMFFPATAAAP